MARIITALDRDGHLHNVPEDHQDLGLTYGLTRVALANPSERTWSSQAFLFWFGCIGTTYVLAWGTGEDSALEAAAEWLAENAPGHLMAFDSPEYLELLTEACGELYPGRTLDSLTEDEQCAVSEQADADLTYTESGYLTSYEWGMSDVDSSEAATAALVQQYQDGELDCYFDRFAICEAWNLWLQHTHGGQGSREYARLSRLSTHFRPGHSAERLETLGEPAAGIYARLLVLSLGGDE